MEIRKKDRRVLRLFAAFLKKNGLTDIYFGQYKKHIPSFEYNRPGELVNVTMGWNGTREHWNFWANVSVRWKLVLTKKAWLDNRVEFWETKHNTYHVLNNVEFFRIRDNGA